VAHRTLVPAFGPIGIHEMCKSSCYRSTISSQAQTTRCTILPHSWSRSGHVSGPTRKST
jgi:hypothetical protein